MRSGGLFSIDGKRTLHSKEPASENPPLDPSPGRHRGRARRDRGGLRLRQQQEQQQRLERLDLHPRGEEEQSRPGHRQPRPPRTPLSPPPPPRPPSGGEPTPGPRA